MAEAKELYLKLPEEELQEMAGLLNSDKFKRLVVMTRAEFAASFPTPEEAQGAMKFMELLVDMPQPEQSLADITSELKHEIELPDRNKQPQ